VKIFLTGFMGAGKTTIGRKLACRLSYGFADLDTYIESCEGKTIPEIFRQTGEDGFRTLEAQRLREFETTDNMVVATGGGAPCFKGNMDWMKAHGITVYLQLKPQTLFGRLRVSKVPRPLIQGMSDAELLSFITSSLAQREPFYRQSALIIDGENLDSTTLLEAIRATR
jgi:shikimate kinase